MASMFILLYLERTESSTCKTFRFLISDSSIWNLKFEIWNYSVLAILIIEKDLEKFWDIYQRFQYDTNVRQVKDISR